MKKTGFRFVYAMFALSMVMPFLAVAAHAGDTFQKPTKDELEMKEQPGYPGAAAVILTQDEEDND